MAASEVLPCANILQRRVLASMTSKQTDALTAPIRYKRCRAAEFQRSLLSWPRVRRRNLTL